MGKRIVIDLSKPGLDEAVASRLELRSLPLGALIAPPSGGMATVAADLRVARARLALARRGLVSFDPCAYTGSLAGLLDPALAQELTVRAVAHCDYVLDLGGNPALTQRAGDMGLAVFLWPQIEPDADLSAEHPVEAHAAAQVLEWATHERAKRSGVPMAGYGPMLFAAVGPHVNMQPQRPTAADEAAMSEAREHVRRVADHYQTNGIGTKC